MLPDPPFPDSGHALHFGEAAGEGGLVQRDDLLHGLFGQFLANTSWLAPLPVCKRYQGTPPPSPVQRSTICGKCQMPGTCLLSEKNTVVGQKNERLFDSARCV